MKCAMPTMISKDRTRQRSEQLGLKRRLGMFCQAKLLRAFLAEDTQQHGSKMPTRRCNAAKRIFTSPSAPQSTTTPSAYSFAVNLHRPIAAISAMPVTSLPQFQQSVDIFPSSSPMASAFLRFKPNYYHRRSLCSRLTHTFLDSSDWKRMETQFGPTGMMFSRLKSKISLIHRAQKSGFMPWGPMGLIRRLLLNGGVLGRGRETIPCTS